MNRSAGTPCSIRFARAEQAAYEIATRLPLSLRYSVAIASSAVLRLAAANTVTSGACARARPAWSMAAAAAMTAFVQSRTGTSRARRVRALDVVAAPAGAWGRAARQRARG